MSKNHLLRVDVLRCEKIEAASHYNWNLYLLPFSIDDRNVLLCAGDDDRTEYYFLVTEDMVRRNDFSDKLPMWCRDSEDDQSVFEFWTKDFGEFPS